MQGSDLNGKLLIVDDDVNITELLTYNLVSEGYIVESETDASKVTLDRVAEMRLVIVDAMSQKVTGLDLCTQIKANAYTESIPVIICANTDGEDAIIEAFDAGADDFIAKPFSLREIVARIKAILRRHPMQGAPVAEVHHMLTIPGSKLTIDLETQKVTENGMIVPLTKTEYAILVFLIKNINTFYTRNDIFNRIWKDDESANARVVDTNISRLRKKLGESGKFIINRYGQGYAVFDKLNVNKSEK